MTRRASWSTTTSTRTGSSGTMYPASPGQHNIRQLTMFDDGVQFLILKEVPKSMYMDTAFCKWSFLNELSALKNVCQQRSQLTGSIKEKVLVGAYRTLRTCLPHNTVLYLHCMTACVQGPHHLRGLRAADGKGLGGERGGCVRTTL